MFTIKRLLVLLVIICTLATFGCSKPQYFTIKLQNEGNGTITISPAQETYQKGSEVEVTAIPDTNWYFSNWSGALTGSVNPAKIIVDSNLVISAVFTENLSPVFSNIADMTVIEGQTLSFTVCATDPEGESVTISTNNLPVGASFTPASGLFEWTPDYFGSGSYEVTFEATDGHRTSNQIAKIIVTDATLKVPYQYATIQAAIDASEDGMVIIVSPGEYIENINFQGKSISLRSTNPDDIETVKMTIINGNQIGSVVTFENGEVNAEITGFTLKNGNNGFGGGIAIRFNSSPIISKNIISSNSISGIKILDNASAVISNNQFKDNTSIEDGGAINISTTQAVTIQSNFFENNTTDSYAGAIKVMGDSQTHIEDNTFVSNQASYGGAIMIYQSTKATILNNTFTYNSATLGGGAICLYITDILIKNNTFIENHAEGGGGLYLAEASNKVENNLFWKNTATAYGGAMLLQEDSSGILNNQFEKNQAPDGAGIYVFTDSFPTIANNQLSENTGGGIYVKNGAEVKYVDGTYWQRNDVPPAEELTNVYLNNTPYNVFFEPQI